MTDILKRLQEYNSKYQKEFYVKELDLTIYHTPASYGEVLKINNLSTVGKDKDGEAIVDDTKFHLYLIIEKCRDKDGKKIFNSSCYEELDKLPASVIAQMSIEIQGNIIEAKKK